jgi:two-component system, chemotaxis family, chemotaxis protein CheY
MKILIVDDDLVCRMLLQDILTPYGNCHTAVNGKEAVKAFCIAAGKKDPYDLICLDIMMPEMDGQETLKEIRRLEKENNIAGSDQVKIIMVTALGDAKSIMESFVKGQCEAYVTKPITVDSILKQVRKLGLIDHEEG